MKTGGAQKAGYRLINHTADIGVRIFGPTEKTLYETAAKALFSLLVEGVSSKEGGIEPLEIEGEDRADLMVNWLRELLYLWTGKGLWVQETQVRTITKTRLSADVRLYPYDPKRQRVKNDIKAVTYHQSQVKRTPSGWEATIIFDV